MPIERFVPKGVANEAMTPDSNVIENKKTNKKKASKQRASKKHLLKNTVRVAEVIAWFVNPVIYVIFSAVYFIIGPVMNFTN